MPELGGVTWVTYGYLMVAPVIILFRPAFYDAHSTRLLSRILAKQVRYAARSDFWG